MEKEGKKNLFSGGKNSKVTAVVAGRCGRASQWSGHHKEVILSGHQWKVYTTPPQTHTHLLLAVRMKVVAVGNC